MNVKENQLNHRELFKHLLTKQSLLRLFTSLGLASTIAIILLNLSNYSYWRKTIYRTQTVDFNMLASLLPSKLSENLINKNYQELQKTIDSNYGLFGIVVTDCKMSKKICEGQNILFVSSGTVKGSNKSLNIISSGEYGRNWQQYLTYNSLNKQLFLLLKNPAPTTAEINFPSPRLNAYNVSSQGNTGKIIGRVYLIRNPPPTFLHSFKAWILNPLSPSSQSSLFLGIILSSILTSLIVWAFCEFLFYKNKKAINAIEASENKRLRAENEAYRFKALWEGFQESFEQDFASVLANRLEELRGLFRRLDVDVDNIVHDMRKAPLLSIKTDASVQIVEKVRVYLEDSSDTKSKELFQLIIKFFQDSERTIDLIDWTLTDLREVANIEPQVLVIQDVIKKFLANLPPNVNQDWLTIEVDLDNGQPLSISNNDWHLRSILKNCIYNATAALTKYHIDQLFKDKTFDGKIIVKCFQDNDNAVIQVSDNGPGFPDDIIDLIYQSQKKVNPNAGNRGRGSLIVNSYLFLHNGKVIVRNNDTGGAEIRFYFPIVPVK